MLKFWIFDNNRTSGAADRVVTLDAASPACPASQSDNSRRECAVTSRLWDSVVYLGPGGPVYKQF